MAITAVAILATPVQSYCRLLVAKFYDALHDWLRAWQQPATYLGAAMIAAIWLSFEFHLAVERDRLQAGAMKNTSNLARVFEEHIVRTLRESDSTLLLLRTAYIDGPRDFDLARWLANPVFQRNLIPEIWIIGPDGAIISSSVKAMTSRIDVSDRAYFRVHRDASKDELYIGAPGIGRVTGARVIQLSRGIRAADGSFQGVLLATLDTQYLVKLYESIDLGKDGAIVLVGQDGIVRASAGFKGDVVGNSMEHSRLFNKITASATGSFLTAGNQDNVKRFVSYRAVKGYPLIVYAGEAEHEILADYWRDRRSYLTIAFAATLLIAIVVAFAIRYRRRLIAAQAALQESEARARGKSRELEVTLEHMNQGIMMVDADRDVVVMNRRLVELLGLPEELLNRHVKLDEVLSHLWATGEFGKEGDAIDPHVRQMILAGGMSTDIAVFERTRPNGVTLEVRVMALPDGGVVRTFSDVSERKRREVQIDHMARHDALTGLANRALVIERLEQALARMRRQHEGFALLYLDLDRFKAVNDTHGHGAGDALLRAAAGRLSDCVRETDTAARLGGDEFLILLAASEREDDAEALAKRVLRSVSAPYDLDGFYAVIGTSVGIAMAPGDGTTVEDLLKNADIALYRAKSEGGNLYHFFGKGHALVPGAREINVGRTLNDGPSGAPRVLGCEGSGRTNPASQ
jgi:diguanylate cyclase (GGDEF)-like protein